MTIIAMPASTNNYLVGRGGKKIQRIIIHVTDGNYPGCAHWFQNPAAHVSAHYIVAMSGEVAQCVAEANTAFQAGDFRVNQTTLGIEHEGTPSYGPWAPTQPQLEVSAALVAGLCKKYGIAPGAATIIAHSSINSGHHCPGTSWPWSKYLGMVQAAMNPPAPVVPKLPPAHTKSPDQNRSLRIFDPASNTVIGAGSLIEGSDKVYLTAETLAALRK